MTGWLRDLLNIPRCTKPSDGSYNPDLIDPRIRLIVEAIRAGGFNTVSSCQGGLFHCSSIPYVDVAQTVGDPETVGELVFRLRGWLCHLQSPTSTFVLHTMCKYESFEGVWYPRSELVRVEWPSIDHVPQPQI